MGAGTGRGEAMRRIWGQVGRRRADDREHREQGATGRPLAARLGILLTLGVVMLVTLSACGEDKPYSTISPRTGNADDIHGLYKLVFYMALVVFVVVQAFIVYTALRFRKSESDDTADRPEQIHGNKTLELTWTIVPAVVLLIILIPTISTLYKFDAAADEVDEGGMIVDVYGKQWWWEVHYPEGMGQPTNLQTIDGGRPASIVTANEIRVPVGKEVVFRLHSNNVIHSFWVPQLSGKMDVIPGGENRLATTPTEVGTYYGECTEFCGEQHAWMRFTVIVEPQEDFDAWVAAWNQPPDQAAAAATGDVTVAPASFGVCLGCHRVNAVDQIARANGGAGPIGLQTVGIAAPYTQGPNLTLFGCRDSFAGGVVKNTPENLRQWLSDPASIKSGNLMATQIKPGTLNPEQIEELATWLEALRLPGGGCPPDPGQDPADAGTQDATATAAP